MCQPNVSDHPGPVSGSVPVPCEATVASSLASSFASPDRLRGIIEATVGQVFGVSDAELGASTRGRARVALARQIAMYIGHVVCGCSLTDVGRTFARDRTTVAHACGVVEDQRDDARFDQTLDLMERIVRWRLQSRGDEGPSGTVGNRG